MKPITLAASLAAFALFFACKQEPVPTTPARDFVYLLQVDGAITPASLEQLETALDQSEQDGARALILML
ncbi:MAG TPA: hypothetical protein PLB73_18525, partial [Leptospiraceae bacterium]|nr:hypothetical protein [Leptospiraceae bacterium]